MSKIQPLKSTYLASSNANQKQFKTAQNPSFSGTASAVSKTAEAEKYVMAAVGEKIDKQMGWVGKISKYLDKNDGEEQSQKINAIFTCTLAPLFIAFNPFAKEDKKTKEYTALRQPISAALAISGGLGMTLLTNAYVAKLASEGTIKPIDMRVKPYDRDYLKYKFNKEYKDSSNKKAFLSECEKNIELDSKITKFAGEKPTKAYLKECRSGYYKKIEKEREKLFTHLISEKPESLSINEATKEIFVSKNGKLEQIGKNIPNMGTKAELNDYLMGNNLHNVKFGKFMKEHFNFEFYKDGKLKPNVLDIKLSETTAMDFMRKTGILGDATAANGKTVKETELNRVLCTISQRNRTVEPIKNALNLSELKAEKIATATGKQATRIAQGLVGEKLGKSETMTLGQCFHHLGLRGEKLQNLMDMNVKDALITVTKDFKGKNIEGYRENAGFGDFAKNIMKNKIGRTVADYKNYSKYTGIFFNLFMTAITCTVLNWSYPRIVERLFPSLVKDSEPTPAKKGGIK